jgi:hypothetical protein
MDTDEELQTPTPINSIGTSAASKLQGNFKLQTSNRGRRGIRGKGSEFKPLMNAKPNLGLAAPNPGEEFLPLMDRDFTGLKREQQETEGTEPRARNEVHEFY